MKILIATDGSEYSENAIASVARRPWPEGTRVKVISVIEPPLVYTTEGWALPPTYYDDLERAQSDHGKKALDRAAALLAERAADLEVETELLRGSPRHAIVDEADAWGADLIVVGSHGRTGIERLLLGSVSHAVASHATCSVEIVRSASGATK